MCADTLYRHKKPISSLGARLEILTSQMNVQSDYGDLDFLAMEGSAAYAFSNAFFLYHELKMFIFSCNVTAKSLLPKFELLHVGARKLQVFLILQDLHIVIYSLEMRTNLLKIS